MRGPSRPITLRAGLRQLGTGLIAYGCIGLVVALVGLIGLVSVAGRIGGLTERTSTQIASLVTTIDSSATVLTDAGATALSFAVTLERTPPTVHQAATTVADVRASLRDIESQLGSVTILGARPLASTASRFGQMATNLEGLDTRLDLIATDLGQNRDKLLANARSLSALGERLSSIADALQARFVEDSIADIANVLTVVLALLVVWALVPAVGALVLGWWLRGLR